MAVDKVLLLSSVELALHDPNSMLTTGVSEVWLFGQLHL
jgi:hypothetical protein